MFLDEIIAKLDELNTRDKYFYEGHENEEAAAYADGYIWIDEIDLWVQVFENSTGDTQCIHSKNGF